MRDAIVVGAGPNGLAAAIELARAGRSVLVIEAEDSVGGGTRSAALTLSGFVHDVCSSIHPLALASPFFRSLALDVEWTQPAAPLAHPLDDGTAVLLERSVDATAEGLEGDATAYRRLMRPFVDGAGALVPEILAPPHVPRHPLLLARFGMLAIRSAASVASLFHGVRARALFAGVAAHSMLPLARAPSAGFALTLGLLGHVTGWPMARGGSQGIADALVAELRRLGGDVRTGQRVASLAELDPARAVLFDVTPRQLVAIAGDALPQVYRRALARFRYGPGVFKLDYALEGAMPWRAPACSRAATIHVGGTFEQIAASEAAVARGEHPERPFVLVVQTSLFDPTRAPAGKHTLWAYCHVPNGSTVDMTERIERQIERFAPGFRKRVLARHVMTPADVERMNANHIGGDISGGIADLPQLFARPVVSLDPYRVPGTTLFLCSSSTPPGSGVHGMCGHFAARSALRSVH